MTNKTKVKVYHAGEWHTVSITYIGYCYNKRHYELEHGGHSVLAFYDEIQDKVDFPGVSGGVFLKALTAHLKREGMLNERKKDKD